MRENELAARCKKAFRPRTTLAGEGAAANLIKELEASAPDQIWVSDITYVATLEGWLYLAVILDLFSRRVVGWKLGETLEAELVVTALKNALDLRQPDEGLYFHSDRGSQYNSQAGMITHAVVQKIEGTEGLHTISALTHPQIVQLLRRKVVSPELFDEHQIVEVLDPDDLKRRYCLCRNPQTAGRETITRERLLERTRVQLDKIANSRRRSSAQRLAVRVGRVLERSKMGKFIQW